MWRFIMRVDFSMLKDLWFNNLPEATPMGAVSPH
jgi:hypothetical protein